MTGDVFPQKNEVFPVMYQYYYSFFAESTRFLSLSASSGTDESDIISRAGTATGTIVHKLHADPPEMSDPTPVNMRTSENMTDITQ